MRTCELRRHVIFTWNELSEGYRPVLRVNGEVIYGTLEEVNVRGIFTESKRVRGVIECPDYMFL